MGFLRSEAEVATMIEEMKRKTKGKYITQGVAFNKDSERQMELLKYVLMHSSSFSGVIKELLADKFESHIENNDKTASIYNNNVDSMNNVSNNIDSIVFAAKRAELEPTPVVISAPAPEPISAPIQISESESYKVEIVEEKKDGSFLM